MKKFFFAAVIAITMMAAGNSASAQTKIGYFSIDQMVGIMPEVAKIDTQVANYQRDSINVIFAQLVEDYNYRDSMLTKTDTTKMPASVKAEHRRNLEADAYQIQNWQNLSQQAVQSKQQELLEPVYQKVVKAMNDVAKEKGYTYILSKDALLVGPPGDDILPLVAAKLKVKLPQQEQQAKPAIK